MTSPDGAIPEKAWTAATVFELQHVDQDELAAGSNADIQAMAESVRLLFFTHVYQAVQQIPIIGGAIGDIIEILTGVEDGDLDDLGSWVNGLGDFVNNFIAGALHALADLLEFIPFVGDDLASVVEGIANGLNSSHSTATTAVSAAATAQTTANTAQATANTAQADANSAVSTAEAAANDAAAAVEVADIAYENASYWEAEAVVASAAVVLGDNELRIGLCQNVPTSKTRKITDLHYALLTQPAGIVIETKKWNAAGTSNSVIHTATLGANVTRINYANLDLSMADKERIFWNVLSVTGTTEPNVLQCAAFGAIF